MHFGAGVKADIGKIILGRAVPPATIAEMLTAAEAVEAELSKRGAPGDSALAITESPEDIPDESSDVDQLTRQVEVSVPQSLAEAIRTKAGAYAAHFRKLPGK